MDFYSLKEYTISDVEQLIQDEVEENIHLDYKRDGALSKDDKKRAEITKDVSAFANSDGGIIVYGLAESDHKPQSITYIDGMVYTKEWLENIINSIQPRIDGVKIYPVRKDNDLKQSLYIVKIPRSSQAPHMAKDKRYYKRFNFLSEPMEDYEVKDVMYRHHSPKLTLINGSLQPDDERTPYSETVRYSFKAWIKNEGKNFVKIIKLAHTSLIFQVKQREVIILQRGWFYQCLYPTSVLGLLRLVKKQYFQMKLLKQDIIYLRYQSKK